MAVANYKTERGAERYAKELRVKFPEHKFVPVPNNSFGYWVSVTTKEGRKAVAAPRPRRFSHA